MIIFDPKKVTHEEVFINNVGRNTIRIVSNGDSMPYENKFGLKGRLIKKTGEFSLQVHHTVTNAFLSIYKTKHFQTKKACLFIYDGEVLFFDSGYESYTMVDGVYCVESRFGGIHKGLDWKSPNIEAMGKVVDVIESRSADGVCLLDGSNLIIRKEDSESVSFMGDPRINIEEVYYLDLSRMVRTTSSLYVKNIVKRYSHFLGKAEDGVSDYVEHKSDEIKTEPKEPTKESMVDDLLNLKSGIVLTFNYGEDGSETGISPLINIGRALNSLKDQSGSKVPRTHNSQVGLFTQLAVSGEKEYDLKVNLHYVAQVARVITKHYGYDKTDFLNIPEVIESVGTINLVSDIDFQDRLKTVVGINPFNALAYLCGFINREDRLNVVRDLKSTFASIIGYGFYYGAIYNNSTLTESEVPLSNVDDLKNDFENATKESAFRLSQEKPERDRKYRELTKGFEAE